MPPKKRKLKSKKNNTLKSQKNDEIEINELENIIDRLATRISDTLAPLSPNHKWDKFINLQNLKKDPPDPPWYLDRNDLKSAFLQYLNGEKGDEFFLQKNHIKLIAYLGSSTGTQTKYEKTNEKLNSMIENEDWDTEYHPYHWVDFNLLDKSGKEFCFRMEVNFGSRDCNTGSWGSVYDRYSAKKMVNITSTDGDSETKISASKPLMKKFHSWDDDLEIESPCTIYGTNHEMEKLIGVVLFNFPLSPSHALYSINSPFDLRVEFLVIMLERIFRARHFHIPVDLIRNIAKYVPVDIPIPKKLQNFK